MQGLRTWGESAGQHGAVARDRLLRSVLAGALVGLLLAWSWVQYHGLALQPLQAREQQLQAQLQVAQALAQRLAEEARQVRAAQEQRERLQSAQQHTRRLLAALENLAEPASVRLTLIRLDAQGWTLRGHADPAQLQHWSAQRPAHAFGAVPAQLVELSTAEQAGLPAGRARFVLRWPALSHMPPLPTSVQLALPHPPASGLNAPAAAPSRSP